MVTVDAPHSVDGESSAERVSVSAAAAVRPHVAGKFLYTGQARYDVKGVTYGPFRPDAEGCEYHDLARVDADFAAMAAAGVNTVRTYTVPPKWLLDSALRHGLRVMVGLPWEQHIAFLDDPARQVAIEGKVRDGVRDCGQHPAILAYAIGNEIPVSIVRWYGREAIEKFLLRLYRVAKQADAGALVTYVNFPTTEFLQLPFLDFVCFNVYLENAARLEGYFARLQSLAHDRPLVLAEIGLDSDRNGPQKQAHVLGWQLRSCFAAGCAGLFVFAWSDEWHRGGADIEDWSFGLVDREGAAKPALAAVSEAFRRAPFPDDVEWPSVTVVVCTYNGSATIRRCCEGLHRLTYPNFNVLIVNDGSTDDTADIVREFDFVDLIEIPNAGLSRARNVGLERATGEIIVYLDDDAWPDPYWLHYIAWTFLNGSHVACGGPNIPPPQDGPAAECVAHAPGGPAPVLLTDRTAEHLPGCNLAFRRDALRAIGGFDPQFRIAGDDVDVCWQVLERDWTIGYHPGAMVWHHRRRSVRAYLRQQTNYGRAEAMLERKWPHKYNSLGHVSWGGRVYGSSLVAGILRRGRVYHGVWGSALFQWLEHEPVGVWRALPYVPEWYLATALLMGAAIWGIFWPPLLLTLPLLAVALGIPIWQAWRSAASITAIRPNAPWSQRLRLRLTTAMLHLVQPMVRLRGRLFSGLTPWRGWRYRRWARPRGREHAIWSEQWQPAEVRLAELETALRRTGPHPVCGGVSDRWDLELRGGMFGSLRVLLAIEEHGGGRQLIRLRAWPHVARTPRLAVIFGIAACILAGAMNWLGLAIVVGSAAVLVSVRAVRDCAIASAAYLDTVDTVIRPTDDPRQMPLWDVSRQTHLASQKEAT